MIKETNKIGIFGISGCGKSTLAKKMTQNQRRIIVFDAVHEYHKAGYIPCKTIKEILLNIRKNPLDFRLAFQIQGEEPDYTEELKKLIRACKGVQKPYADEKKYPKLLLIIEEMPLSLPNQNSKELNFFRTFFNKDSRHSGVDVIGIAQRCVEVSTNFRGNMTETFFYNTNSATDIKTVADYIGVENAKKITTLETFCCFHKKRGEITAEKHQP